MSRSRLRTCIRLLLLSAPAVVAATSARDAHAQSAGTTNTPIPNVLLLIDTSGSMERMPDNSLPVENHDPAGAPGAVLATGPFNKCQPGIESNPNRWGMLVQALTGNMQPFYSCAEMSRAAGTPFANEFKISGVAPYDVGYTLPYHRPLSGGSAATACAFAPRELPGASPGSGVGPAGLGITGSNAKDFPGTAFQEVLWSHLNAQYTANAPIASGNACTFDQAPDGQLDATRDYVRFSLMTFDTDPTGGTFIGVSSPNPNPGGTIQLDPATTPPSPFSGLWSYYGNAPATGNPPACIAQPFEVGARHWAAPPWEGRHIPFPDPQGTLYDIARTNDQIQKVIMSSRPFGATPIDGLLSDAQHYLKVNDYGPSGTQAGFTDPYVKNGCRQSYIILLTDGAPNLNLRKACEGSGGTCPFSNQAWQTVQALYNATPNVRTFVIGFSVNGSTTTLNGGFPASYTTQAQRNCKAWYADAPPTGGGGTPLGMEAACTLANPSLGTTADACCQLNKIAFYGSGANASAVGAFFAETQADLVLSFGRILANISKDATSRTPPAFSPVVTLGGNGVSAKYVTSFIPNALKPWSGEIDRTRAVCPAGTDQPQTPHTTTGDSYAQNTAAQSAAGNRFFMSVKGASIGSVIDSGRTLRPYVTATAYTDNLPAYVGTEVADIDDNIATSVTNWAEAMDVDANTCKRSRVPNRTNPQITDAVPRLSQTDCRDVIWNFTTASAAAMNKSGIGPGGTTVSYDFNVRCRGTGGLSNGTCSLSGSACTVGVAGGCPIGQVCVPECAALGAVYHSTPAVVGTPAAFLREDSFTQFAQNRRLRRPAMYVATTDGVLHAFKALETSGGNGAGSNNAGSNWELWGFVPPAVLPKLSANYPTGQQILLDGSPIVKDVVWDRAAIGNADQWHTTLVAGLGAGGGGYYALNVTDSNCGSAVNSECTPATWQQASTLDDASIGGLDVRKRGPHFLWQLSDFEKSPTENGVIVRAAKTAPPVDMVGLFGRTTGTPAITTLRFDPGDGLGNRQIGVAILPGGIDGPPATGGTGCSRGINGGGYLSATFDRSDSLLPPRGNVRQWGTTCGSKVLGRSVTIVRLDTGEIIRHFGRDAEAPTAIRSGGHFTDSPFDSPIVGIPSVFPNAIGQFAQRAIVGDADGTLWNIDLTNADPALWKVTLFQDLFSGGSFSAGQPVSIPLTLTQDSTGALVVNAATGDQENITASSIVNYVYSIRETPTIAAATPARSEVKWRRALPNGERVTGPMVVFDRILYFATHLPDPIANVCGNLARSRLWGMDFLAAASVPLTDGGLPRWCPRAQVNPTSGICNVTVSPTDPPFEDIPEAANAIIPGVTLRPTLSCNSFDTTDPSGGINGITPQRFELFFSFSTPRGSGGTPQASRLGVAVPVPRIAAIVDAWSLVFD
jgi:type IV pilus assembly protein PilY1